MNDFDRCRCCDIRLIVGECYFCASCAAEHDRGYQENLAIERQKLLIVLSVQVTLLATLRGMGR